MTEATVAVEGYPPLDILDLRSAFRLTERDAKVMLLLLAEKMVQHPVLMTTLEIDDKLKAHAALYRLRRRMEVYGVVVSTMYGAGYYLTPSMKQNAARLVHEAQSVAA